MEMGKQEHYGDILLPGKFNILIGAQAGSEAKGKAGGWIVNQERPDALFMASSPNAGHTVYDLEGKKRVTYHLPASAWLCDSPVYLGPTSLINPVTLAKEMADLPNAFYRIHIDRRASAIGGDDIEAEVDRMELGKIGSTLQGVGGARGRRLNRDPAIIRIHQLPNTTKIVNQPEYDVSHELNTILDHGGTILCEMTQGFDLDLEHGIDPRYCTSKMINPAMAMAEAGVSPSAVGRVIGVVRPYPIRVNNRDGSSGPYPGTAEISWGDVATGCGAPVDITEYTTTTKLQRRVFTFSWSRFARFCTICRPGALVLQFANYLDWDVYGATDEEDITDKVMAFIRELEDIAECPVVLVGTGPKHEHMIRRYW